ncbi:extensin family protein [Xanthobacter aminoxidans]|uniref:extensin family protein n=1 Tax=Xanthobacter aminoxidans TaxID=186280 RepID=UPI0020230B24|nr:extensin family protein [Xanthobacter aminoxidans]
MPDAALRRTVPWTAGIPVAVCIGLVAFTMPGPSSAATPLPPVKPKDLKASSSSAVARVPSLRAAPLPPRRPPELAEEDSAAEADGQDAARQEGPVDVGRADRFVRDPVRPAQRPQVASRETAPDAAVTSGGPRVPTPSAVSPSVVPSPPAGPMMMPAACADLIAEGAIEASLETSLTPSPVCGTFIPVRLTAVRLADGRMLPLKPAAISRCEMTVAAAAWMSEALAPAVAAAGGELTAIRIADSYNCRPRNRVAGAKMSEHGRGNAVDVGGFELGDGRVWTVAKGGLPMALRASMKDSACTRFATVLGPGSDGYHEDHIHVDLAQRRNDFKLCHWNLDAGSAVASRKDKPAANAPAASTGGGDDEAAEKAAAAAAENAEAEPQAQSAPLPPPKGGAATGKPTTGKPATGKGTAKSDAPGADRAAKPGQTKTSPPKNTQTKDSGSKGSQPKQGQAD